MGSYTERSRPGRRTKQEEEKKSQIDLTFTTVHHGDPDISSAAAAAAAAADFLPIPVRTEGTFPERAHPRWSRTPSEQAASSRYESFFTVRNLARLALPHSANSRSPDSSLHDSTTFQPTTTFERQHGLTRAWLYGPSATS